MITNFPKEFNLSWLDAFDFGQPDAKEDSLLNHCRCNIAAFSEFLNGNKDIILGERGTGKSALFRLIRDKENGFEFKLKKTKNKSTNKRQILVPIDEELNYLAKKDKVISKFNENSFDLETKLRFGWELFILFRIVSVLKDEFPNADIISDIYKALIDAFDIQSKDVGIFELFFKQKKTIGIKIDNLQSGFATPNFYASIEPSQNSSNEEGDTTVILTIDDFKKKINNFLGENGSVVYVLIDKLDEFVVKEEYEAQKKAIQGLLHCQRGYISYSNIKLRLFLRTDLFYRLDFQALGYDKVIAKTVELKWSSEGMREFIARRVLYNLSTCTSIKRLEVSLDEVNLSTNALSLPQKYPAAAAFFRRIPFAVKIYQHFKRFNKNIKIRKMDTRDGRKINFNDALSIEVIRSAKSKFKQKALTYNEIKKLYNKSCGDENELRQFLAFLAHLGLLQCSNSRTEYANRTYQLPILFK